MCLESPSPRGGFRRVVLCCFPGESHFDDCQCDFNAISQLQGTPPVFPGHVQKGCPRDTDRNADICGLNCNLCSCNIEARRSNCKCIAFSRIVCANLTGSRLLIFEIAHGQ